MIFLLKAITVGLVRRRFLLWFHKIGVTFPGPKTALMEVINHFDVSDTEERARK